MPLPSTTRTQDERSTELLPKGLYKCAATKRTEPQASSLGLKKNGQPADDIIFVTFEIAEGRMRGKTFDLLYSWNADQSFNSAGQRTWAAPLVQMVEGFLGRPVEEGEDVEYLLDDAIIRTGILAYVSVIQKPNKDKTKLYNAAESINPVEI